MIVLTIGTSLNRVVNRGERISNVVDQARFSTSADTTAPRPNRLSQAFLVPIGALDLSRSWASNGGRGDPAHPGR